MEEKKFNNAIEKAENISEDTQKVKGGQRNNTSERERELSVWQKMEEDNARKRILKAERKQRKGQPWEQEKRQKNKKRGGNSQNISGWLAAVVALGCVCLILSSILIYDVFMRGSGESMLSNAYAKNFYGLVGYVDNIDVNLSKLTTSNDNENRQKILCDVMIEANLAEAEISALPLAEHSKQSTEKFINQLGDFSKYLNNKLIEGDSLDESDLKTLREMKKINSRLRESLKKLEGEMGGDFDFMTLLSGEENPILDSFNELEYHAVEYPKMIYDGPFADEPDPLPESKRGGEIEEITKEEAIKIFERCFAEYKPTEISVVGMAEGKRYSVYDIEAKIEDKTIFAQVSEHGKLVMFDTFTKGKEKKFTRDECVDNALNFLNKCGYKSIKAVWATGAKDNMTYINFASVCQNGEVIEYSDLIKVGVCMDSGRVCDMDAHLYVENHKDREIPEPRLRVEEAERKISEDIEVETSRLALIPVGKNKEKLAYEFFGKGREGSFYIYIDAITGKELQIFKVIGTDDGELLL